MADYIIYWTDNLNPPRHLRLSEEMPSEPDSSPSPSDFPSPSPSPSPSEDSPSP